MGGYPVPVTTVEEKDAGGLNDPPIPQVCTARPQGLNPKPYTSGMHRTASGPKP